MARAVEIRKEAPVVDRHPVERRQALTAVFAPDLELQHRGVACLSREMLANEALDVARRRRLREKPALTEQSNVFVGMWSDHANPRDAEPLIAPSLPGDFFYRGRPGTSGRPLRFRFRVLFPG